MRAGEARSLSVKETAVLELASEGLTVEWIAEHLEVSPSTVRTHLKRAYKVLGVHSRAAAVVAFLGLGLPSSFAAREAAVTARERAVDRAPDVEAARAAGHREGWEAAVVALGNVHIRDWQRALNGPDLYGTRAGRILAAHLRRNYTEEGTTGG